MIKGSIHRLRAGETGIHDICLNMKVIQYAKYGEYRVKACLITGMSRVLHTTNQQY